MHLRWLIGTTEVVPCYKAFFRLAEDGWASFAVGCCAWDSGGFGLATLDGRIPGAFVVP